MTNTEFSRARSAEQREARRVEILRTAAAMLAAGTRVADLSLNELARRVGLAKSNVLRYFETREAVLLTLLDAEYTAWLDEVEAELGAGATTAGAGAKRGGGAKPADIASAIEHIAEVLSRTIAERQVLAELVASAAMVLEHNVSAEIAASYKRQAVAQAMRTVRIVERQLGALPEASAIGFAAAVNMAVGGAWGMCRPSPGMAAAYKRYPELASLRLDFRVAVRELVAVVLVGLLARPVSLASRGHRAAKRGR